MLFKEGVDVRKVEGGVVYAEGILEPKLRDAALEGHLTALKAPLEVIARAGPVALVAARGGFSVAAAFAASQTLFGVGSARCRPEPMQNLTHTRSILTRWATFFSIPKIDKLTSFSTVWPRWRSPKARSVSFC
jgi:hypothetical protein